MRKIFTVGCFIFSLLFSSYAFATSQEVSYVALSKVLTKLRAVDVTNDKVIDEYAKINYCDIYSKYYNNEIEWAKIKKAIRLSIAKENETSPLSFYYDSVVDLNKYDVNNKLFKISPSTPMKRVGTIDYFVTVNSMCGGSYNAEYFFPHFKFVLDDPIAIETVPANDEVAAQIIKRFLVNKDETRSLPIRFSFNIHSFGYDVNQRHIMLFATLDKVEFFSDAKKTQVFYTYKNAKE